MSSRRNAGPKLAGILFIAAALGGCAAVGPDYRRPEVALPANYDTSPDSAGAAIDRRWWTLFRDETLDRLVERALSGNADLQAAAARVEQADAVLKEAGSALFPQIDLGANAGRSRISSVSGTPLPSTADPIRNNFQVGLSTAFELDFWGRLRRASEAARAQALGSRHARDTIALTLVSQVSNAYLNLRSLDAQLSVSRQTLSSREDALGIVRSRASRGLASDLDLQQSIGAVAAIRAQIADLERQRAVSEHQLGVLTGEPELHLPAGDLAALPLPPLPPAGLPSSLLDARPDIRQSEAQLAAANAQIGVARAQLFPSISLTGTLGSQSRELADLFSRAASIWSFGIALDLPIFDAGRRAARVEQATAQQKQALASYVQSIRSAFSEVRDALTASTQYAQIAASQQIQTDAAERALELVHKRYKAGYSPYLEVLDAQRSANDAKLGYLRARQAQLVAAVSLYAALGGGWRGDVAADAPGR